jgi:feruloyl-CoA synthase
VPGVEIKLAAIGDRWELRVRGVTVTPGYWRNAVATAAAFDEEGFFKTGDAAELLDPNDPSRGIIFAGRIAENFKLSSGTWVNVGAIRLALLEAGAPLIADVVLTGADRDELGALVFTSGDGANATSTGTRLREILADHNARNPSSSGRIARALILHDAPNAAVGEITDKGSVNQSRVLSNRRNDVERLYTQPPDDDIIVLR